MDRRHFILLGSAWSVTALARHRKHRGVGTGTATPPPPMTAPSPLTAGQPLADLVRLANTSTTPNLFEATLVAERASKTLLAGRSTEFWTYNGLVPGPLIEVFEGDTVRIRLENRLSQETTVHWHGLPVPPDQDGSPMDPSRQVRAARMSSLCRWAAPGPTGITRTLMGIPPSRCSAAWPDCSSCARAAMRCPRASRKSCWSSPTCAWRRTARSRRIRRWTGRTAAKATTCW